VKGLAELVDLYIKPSAAPVNMLSGVGSTKDTVVPAAERKIVFNGLEALFSFHKNNFLPALEVAAAPMMKPATVLQEEDSDGQLSLNVGKAVASMFIKHAAFMKMYSSYIKYASSFYSFIHFMLIIYSATLTAPYSASNTGHQIVLHQRRKVPHLGCCLGQVRLN
jgi:hypothetical protein